MNIDPQLELLCAQLKREVPGSMAVAIYSYRLKRVVAIASDIPDTNADHLSTTHVGMFAKFSSFATTLPWRIAGQLHSVVLGLEEATFFMTIDGAETAAMMIACDTAQGNRGLMRVLSKRYLAQAVALLERGAK